MKSILFLVASVVALTTVAQGRVAVTNQNYTIPSAKVWLVQTITFSYVNRLLEELRDNMYASPGEAMASIIPPIDDPLIVAPVEIPVEIRFDIDGKPISVTGLLALTDDTEVTGLGNLEDNFELSLQLPPYKAAWDVTIPSINVNGLYNMDLILDLGTPHSVTGSGALTASVTEVFLHIVATLKVVGNLGVRELELDLGFKGLTLDGGEAHVDETPINWESVGNNLQTWFDTTWTNNPEVKGIITEAVRCSVDHVINSCTLIGLPLDPSCLKIELNMDCLLPPTTDPTEPPTTDPTVPPTSDPTEPPTTDPTVPPTSDPTEPPTSDPTTTTAPTTTSSGFSTMSSSIIIIIVSIVARFC
ncbi:uncharacterized protein LOC110843257 isoform X2 [Folsomia candida]|uniref:uncharacterized protein LOC110843257 isoform X2 n=1 Tax=Folsomia candida TaxID=158441 RepID=UPI001604A70B|nr:uncharacterized protein LOC110843257 isoform X2 [Folsomia candida]